GGFLAFGVKWVVEMGPTFLEPFLGHLGIDEQIVEPVAHFHIALFPRVPTHGPHRLLCFFFVDSQQLVLGHDINFNTALLVGLLDRLYHHRIRANLGHDQRAHPFFDQAQRCAPTGLAHGGPGEGHDVVDGFWRSQIGGKSRRRIFGIFRSRRERCQAQIHHHHHPSDCLHKRRLLVLILRFRGIFFYFFIFFCSILSIVFNSLPSLVNLETEGINCQAVLGCATTTVRVAFASSSVTKRCRRELKF